MLDVKSLDINGDGRDDVLIQTGTSSASSYKYMLYDGTPFTALVTITSGIKTSATVGLSGKSRRSTSEKQEDDNEKRFNAGNTSRISQINYENKTWSLFNLYVWWGIG